MYIVYGVVHGNIIKNILGLAIIYKTIVAFLKAIWMSEFGSYTWVNKQKRTLFSKTQNQHV